MWYRSWKFLEVEGAQLTVHWHSRQTPGPSLENGDTEVLSARQVTGALRSAFSCEVSSAPIRESCLHFFCSGKCDSIYT